MKKKTFTFIAGMLMLLIGNYITAQDINFDCVKQMGGTDDDRSYSTAIDAMGNVYISGKFGEIADFDPGAGTFNLDAGAGHDIFVQKLDAAGNLVWVKQMAEITGNGSGQGSFLALDDSGNVYVTGYFKGTVDFDPGMDSFNLSVVGGDDIFVQKLDDSGNLVWTGTIGGTATNRGRAITADALGNVYTTGFFSETADFDPGTGTLNLSSVGGENIFIQKLDASGNLVWAKQIGGAGSDRGYSIVSDASGSVFTTGFFAGTVDFDPGAGTSSLSSAGADDIFIQKLDASGNFVWVKQIGGTGFDTGYALIVDDSGNIYTTGTFEGTVDFDPGMNILNLSAAGGSDIFIQKLDALGDLVWVSQMGGPNFESGRSLAIDDFGEIYITGTFQGTVDFDPAAGTYNLSAAGGDDIFIQKLDASGNLVWAQQIGGTGGDRGYTIALDGSGNIYTAGYFAGIVDFDPGMGSNDLTSAGEEDVFILKLHDLTISTDDLENSLGVLVYPNPTSDLLNIDKGNNPEINIRVIDNTGKVFISKTSHNQITSLDLSNYASGIYYLSISNGENTKTKKIVKF